MCVYTRSGLANRGCCLPRTQLSDATDGCYPDPYCSGLRNSSSYRGQSIFACVRFGLPSNWELSGQDRARYLYFRCVRGKLISRLRALLYLNSSRHAGWRTTTVSHAAYMADYASRSPWCVIPGFRKELILWDWMHVGPLGFCRDFTGSVVLDMLQRNELSGPAYADIDPSDHDSILKRLWHNFRGWCRLTGRSLPKGGLLTLSSLGLDSSISGNHPYPHLPSAIKAVSSKDFAVYLARLTDHLVPSDAGPMDHCRLRASCAWGIADFIHVTDNGGLILTEEQCARMAKAADVYCTCYTELAAKAATAKRRIWKLRPKFHYFAHLVDFSVTSRLNPTMLACWMEESYLSKVKQLVVKCSAQTVLETSLLRYYIFLGLRWNSRKKKT